MQQYLLEKLINPEEYTKERTDIFKSVLDLSPNCIFVKNKAGEYLLANDAAAKVAGLANGSEMVGKIDEELPFLKEKAAIYKEDDIIVFTKGVDIKVSKDAVIDNSGVKRWFQYTKKPIKNKEGQVVLMLGVASDITEKVNTQDLLKEKLKDLQKYIESNSELLKFASVVSHDFKEPLRQISLFSQLLGQEKLTESGKKSNDIIRNTSIQLSKLVEDLMKYTQVENKSFPRTMLNIDLIIKKATDNLIEKINSSGAEIIITSRMPQLYGREFHFVQLFQNLISNALKFKAKDQATKITISHHQEGEKHTFSIQDNGIGISKENSEKVFEVFKRMHPKSKYEGTGIGLATCQRIIEKCQGEIWVDTSYTRGAKISFTIYQ